MGKTKTTQSIIWRVAIWTTVLGWFFTLIQPGVAAAQESDVLVLELFTSQGCSSCPPADRMLNRLGQSDYIEGNFIPLAFHVDYWDRLGWKDPFSSPRWTARQRIYAQHFNLENLYTPQLVINGTSQGVGNNDEKVLPMIAAAQKISSGGRLQLSVKPLGTTDRQIQLTIQANIVETTPGPDLTIMVAVLENGLTTRVKAGENAGWIMNNDHVVRLLEPTYSIPSQAGSTLKKPWSINLSPDWKPRNLAIVAFLQNPKTLVIHGGTRQRIRTR